MMATFLLMKIVSSFRIFFMNKFKEGHRSLKLVKLLKSQQFYMVLPKTFPYYDRKARAKFQGKKNNIFDFTAFRIQTIRKIFDLMHGLDIQELSFAEASEALIYCNYATGSSICTLCIPYAAYQITFIMSFINIK